MKNTSLIALCFFSIASFAQNNMSNDTSASPPVISSPAAQQPVGDANASQALNTINVSIDPQGNVSVMIPQMQQRDVQKDWVAYVGHGSKGKAEVINGDNVQRGAINKNISPDAFDITCRQLGTNDGVRLTVWLTGDNSRNVSQGLTNDRNIALQKYVRDFAVMEYKYAVSAELKGQQAKEASMENAMTKLIKEEEKAEKKTEENNQAIKKAKDAILTNEQDIQSTNTKIEAQKTNVANNAGDPNAMKGANKTLDEMEGQKKALQRQNDKLNKDILRWTDEIRANDRFIADTKEKETAQRALIEQQKQIVSNVQAKLASIK
jgi:hypothetical protein